MLLDLKIPVRQAGFARPQNGVNLAQEIQSATGAKRLPVILMTAFPKEGLDCAADLNKFGVVEFINKPFPSSGRTLDRVIRDVLGSRAAEPAPAAAAVVITPPDEPQLRPFTGGEVVFFPHRVELCGVIVNKSDGTDQIRQILECLSQKLSNGNFKAWPGAALADEIGTVGGQNAVSGAVRNFRSNVHKLLGDSLHLLVQHHDVIETDGPGYRFAQNITVRFEDGVEEPLQAASESAAGSIDQHADWILAELRKGRQIRRPTIAQELRCSDSHAKKVLRRLVEEEKVVFKGPSKTGGYVLVPS